MAFPIVVKVPSPSETLWADDPRVGIEPNSLADQSAKWATLKTLAQTNPNADVAFPPGRYNFATLDIDWPDTQTIPIRGAGGKQHEKASTIFYMETDRGPDVIPLRLGGGVFQWRLEGICFYGPRDGGGVSGVLPANNDCVLLNNRGVMRDVSVVGFRSGAIIRGDHILIDDCDLRGNGYGLDWGSGQESQGDVNVRHTALDSCTLAAVGVAEDTKLGDVIFERCPLGPNPFGFLRYSVPGGPYSIGGNWILDLTLIECATEYLGHGLFFDHPGYLAAGNGSGIDGVVIEGANDGEYSVFQSAPTWAGMPEDAVWWTRGNIANVEYRNGHVAVPGLPDVPSMKAGGFQNVQMGDPRSVGPHWASAGPPDLRGHRFFALHNGAVNSDQIQGLVIARPRGNRPGYHAAKVTTGSVEQYDLVARDSSHGLKRHSGAATDIPLGFAMHPSALNEINAFCVSGAWFPIKARNKTGGSIASGALLKPDPANAGGVVAATGWNDGPIVAKALGTISAGGSNEVEVLMGR